MALKVIKFTDLLRILCQRTGGDGGWGGEEGKERSAGGINDQS